MQRLLSLLLLVSSLALALVLQGPSPHTTPHSINLLPVARAGHDQDDGEEEQFRSTEEERESDEEEERPALDIPRKEVEITTPIFVTPPVPTEKKTSTAPNPPSRTVSTNRTSPKTLPVSLRAPKFYSIPSDLASLNTEQKAALDKAEHAWLLEALWRMSEILRGVLAMSDLPRVRPLTAVRPQDIEPTATGNVFATTNPRAKTPPTVVRRSSQTAAPALSKTPASTFPTVTAPSNNVVITQKTAPRTQVTHAVTRAS